MPDPITYDDLPAPDMTETTNLLAAANLCGDAWKALEQAAAIPLPGPLAELLQAAIDRPKALRAILNAAADQAMLRAFNEADAAFAQMLEEDDDPELPTSYGDVPQ